MVFAIAVLVAIAFLVAAIAVTATIAAAAAVVALGGGLHHVLHGSRHLLIGGSAAVLHGHAEVLVDGGEQLVNLFEPYRTTKEKGTGLGLMITARIIHDHGGTIDVESKVDEGTTFIIRLPRLERRVRALK